RAREVAPVQVDALALLRHLVREAPLAPVVDLEDLAAEALDDALDLRVHLGHAVVGGVRPQDVYGLVFARRAGRVAQALQSCHVCLSGKCPSTRGRAREGGFLADATHPMQGPRAGARA